MIIKENPKESDHELALVKVAAWTWCPRGPASEETISVSNYTSSSDIITWPSRYKLEAVKKAEEDTKVATQYFCKSMLSKDHVGSSLLDVYEIERISKDLHYYMESSCNKYHGQKSVDGVHVRGGQRILPTQERNSSGTESKRTRKQKKWFGQSYGLCRSSKGDVLETVGFCTKLRQVVQTKI